MNRRNFLRTLIGGVVGAAVVRTWPFRVYSFPSTIQSGAALTPDILRRALGFLSADRTGPSELLINPVQYEAYVRLAMKLTVERPNSWTRITGLHVPLAPVTPPVVP